MQFKNILFPTDFSEASEQALDQAMLMARDHGATLHMLHVTVLLGDDPHNPAFHFPDTGEIFDRVHQLCNSDMAKLADRLPQDSVEVVQAQVRNPSAATGILEYVKDNAIDLVVMTTEGRRGLRRALMGSVASKVVQLAPCPVLTVRESDPPREAKRIAKVLVPVDFSMPSQQALKVALDVAQRHGAALEALHVVEDFSNFPSFYRSSMPSSDAEDTLGKQAEEQLSELMRRLGREREQGMPETTVAHTHGKAADAVAAHADKTGADLIVIATRGLTGLSRVLIGSTAERVIAMADCPVMSLKLTGDADGAEA
jgi:nucleotide-binding universal stress UspA family protein